MRFSSFVLLVVAASASPVSATPIDAGAEECPWVCYDYHQCNTCWVGTCVSFSGLHPRLNHIVPSYTVRLFLRSESESCFCFHISEAGPWH
jgi:hypothetical protein